MTDLVPLQNTPTREQIDALQAELAKLPQATLSLHHYFAQGLYARELQIPAGCALTGMVHKTEHLNILSLGTITVWTEDGMKTVSAPFTMVSRPGTKRVGFAHTDVVWTTIHATEERDIDKLEQELVEYEPSLIQYDRIEVTTPAPTLENQP